MNQRKFNKIMKFNYCNNMVSQNDIDYLYEIERKSIFKNNNISNLLEKNFHEFISHRAKGYLDLIIKRMLEDENLKNIVENNFMYILSESNELEIKYILNLEYEFDFMKKINDNFDYFLNNFNMKKLFILNENNLLNNENKEKLNNLFQKNEDEFLKVLFFRLDEVELDKVLDILKMLINELGYKENIRLVDIKRLQPGNFSEVIEIGSKVLKLGNKRQTHNIPNSKYILNPIIRRDLSNISNSNMVLEVSEKADINVKLNKEQLYNFYKKLRSEGIIYADIKPENIGILLKDNIVHYNGVSLDYKNKGFDKDIDDVLKKGEYVIIDTDFLYNESDKNIKWGNVLSSEFERRYKEEINKEKENLDSILEEKSSNYKI